MKSERFRDVIVDAQFQRDDRLDLVGWIARDDDP